MKKIFLAACFAALCHTAICQTTLGQGTTMDEYNYVTKGYKTTIEQGLDIKKGYSIHELFGTGFKFSNTPGLRIVPMVFYPSNGTQKNLAAIMMVIYVNNLVDKVICIPNNNTNDPDIIKLSNQSINNLYGNQRELFDYAVTRLLAFYLSK